MGKRRNLNRRGAWVDPNMYNLLLDQKSGEFYFVDVHYAKHYLQIHGEQGFNPMLNLLGMDPWITPRFERSEKYGIFLPLFQTIIGKVIHAFKGVDVPIPKLEFYPYQMKYLSMGGKSVKAKWIQIHAEIMAARAERKQADPYQGEVSL